MIKTLAKSIREYKLPTIITLIFIMGEVLMEAYIPFITADLVNNIKALAMSENPSVQPIIKTGLYLVLMAAISLACGIIAALTCAKASAGFAKNLRHDMFAKIQSYSFANIDKFSST